MPWTTRAGTPARARTFCRQFHLGPSGGIFAQEQGHIFARLGPVEALEQFRRHGLVVGGALPDAVHQGVGRGQVGPVKAGIVDGGRLDGIDGLPGIDPHHLGPVIEGLEAAGPADGPGGLAVGVLDGGDQPITPGDKGFIGNGITPGGPGGEQGELDRLVAGRKGDLGFDVPGVGFGPRRQGKVERQDLVEKQGQADGRQDEGQNVQVGLIQG